MNLKAKAKHCLRSWCRYPLRLEKVQSLVAKKKKNKITHLTLCLITLISFVFMGGAHPKSVLKCNFPSFLEIGYKPPTTPLLLTSN